MANIKLDERVDITKAEQLYELCDKSLEDSSHIQIDAKAVGFLDTAALQVLLSLKTKAEQLGVDFSISNASNAFLASLKVFGSLEIFEPVMETE